MLFSSAFKKLSTLVTLSAVSPSSDVPVPTSLKSFETFVLSSFISAKALVLDLSKSTKPLPSSLLISAEALVSALSKSMKPMFSLPLISIKSPVSCSFKSVEVSASSLPKSVNSLLTSSKLLLPALALADSDSIEPASSDFASEELAINASATPGLTASDFSESGFASPLT